MPEIPSWVFEFIAKLLSEIILGILTIVAIYLREVIAQHIGIAYHTLKSLLLGRRYLLLWVDTEYVVVKRLAGKIQTRCKDSEVKILRAPVGILSYPMRPRRIEAIVLINTDVSKLASDDRVRSKIQRRIETFLLRGGGVVGAHDIIYRRARNERLQNAFGGAIVDFLRVNTPVQYVKSDQHRDHPIAANMPDRFALDDGEIIWGEWERDTQTLFHTPEPDSRSLVVARHYHVGRVVWLSSCDHRERICSSIGTPDELFVDLLIAATTWVAQREWIPRRYPFVVAHRGAPWQHHENTRPAFQAAIDLQADFIECDVRRTRDKILVLHHDATFFGARINDCTYSELRDLGEQHGAAFTRLDELFDLARGNIKLDLEIKEEGYEREIFEAIKASNFRENEVVITSFHDASLRRFKMYGQHVRCGLLLGRDRPPNWVRTRWTELFPLKRLKQGRADFVAPNYRLLKFGFVRRLTALGFPIWVWTVDSPDKIARLLKTRGVEAVITNAPDLGLEQRERLHAKLRAGTEPNPGDSEGD